jgi:hypothetical protein
MYQNQTSGVFMEKLTCDSCRRKIKSVQDGWVEWISFAEINKTGQGLRVVHKNSGNNSSCQYEQKAEYDIHGGILSDSALEQFIGPDGLMRLLVMISENELPKMKVLEMIKRIHTPGYDHAKDYFDEAISQGFFEPNMPRNFYLQ